MGNASNWQDVVYLMSESWKNNETIQHPTNEKSRQTIAEVEIEKERKWFAAELRIVISSPLALSWGAL